jgi:methylmalonyl-CoA mutase N-terminal domain/subunit
LRTQQILARNQGRPYHRPLAGSYLIEHLTDEIESQARRYLERIEAMGAPGAIERGFMQAEITGGLPGAAGDRSRRGRRRRVNKFQTETAPHLDVLRVNPRVEAEQRQRLAAVRARRDAGQVAAILERLRRAAGSKENLVGLFVEAVEADVTLGEICNALRQVWGEYRPAGAW